MNINPINSNNTKYNTFGYSGKTVLNRKGRVLYRTTTYSFRDDLDWIKFAKEIANHYKNTDKVNVINYGCSTGEEVFTFIMSMLATLKKESRKFFPVVAKDIDKLNIVSAKEGTIYADKDEFEVIKDYTKPYTNKFLDFCEHFKMIHFKSTVRKNAQFSQADILKDIDNIPEEKTVLFCRNFLMYLKEKDMVQLFDKIAHKFKDTSSVLVLGNYDSMEPKVRSLLLDHGFVSLGKIDNAFIKKYESVNKNYTVKHCKK